MPVYDGPSFNTEIKCLDELRQGLNWISNQGFIPNFMDGPQSVGLTLKKALNINSNKLQLRDGSHLKIKCSRKKSKSKITGFTKSPTWLSGWDSKRLLREFGYQNKKSSHSLMTEIGIKPNNQSLFLQFSDNCILLCNPSGPFAMYSFDTIQGCLNKLGNTVLVTVESKLIDEREYFHYDSADLVKINHLYSMEEMKSQLASRMITLEIRMYLKENGSVRDHGFAFRFSPAMVDGLYVRESIISS